MFFLMEAYVKHVTRSVGDFGTSYNLKQYKLVRYYYVVPMEAACPFITERLLMGRKETNKQAYVKHVTKTFDDFGPR